MSLPTIGVIIHVNESLDSVDTIPCRAAIVRGSRLEHSNAIPVTIFDNNPAAPVRLAQVRNAEHWHYPDTCPLSIHEGGATAVVENHGEMLIGIES